MANARAAAPEIVLACMLHKADFLVGCIHFRFLSDTGLGLRGSGPEIDQVSFANWLMNQRHCGMDSAGLSVQANKPAPCTKPFSHGVNERASPKKDGEARGSGLDRRVSLLFLSGVVCCQNIKDLWSAELSGGTLALREHFPEFCPADQ